MFCGASGAIEKLEELHQFRVIVYIRNPGRPSRSLPQTKSKLQDPSIAYISTSQNMSDLRLNTWSISLHRRSLKEKFKSLVGPRCTRGKICVWRNVNTVEEERGGRHKRGDDGEFSQWKKFLNRNCIPPSTVILLCAKVPVLWSATAWSNDPHWQCEHYKQGQN